MRAASLASLVLVFWTSLSLALSTEPERTVEILAWPASAPKPLPLARVAYNSTTARLVNYHAPSTPGAADDVVRVGFYRDLSSGGGGGGGSVWSGVATSAASLTDPRPKKLQLLLTAEGELYHLGYQLLGGSVVGQTGKGVTEGDLQVQVVTTRPGPQVHLNRPVAVTPDGTPAGEEQEKSFFQKYWWVILGVILVQMVMAGPKE